MTLPAWVATLTDDDLRRRSTPGALTRGRAYARDGAVRDLQARPDGALQADVLGSGPVYRTVVRVGSRGGWSGDCSCPVGFDCKHAVAVLLVARARAMQPQAVRAVTAPWEQALAGLLVPVDDADAPALGLVVALQDQQVRLRPVRDNGGRWVKSGATWRDLTSAYGFPRCRQAHRDALLQLHAAWRVGQPSWYSPGSDTWISLADAGPRAFAVLADVERAGVVLLDDGNLPTVRLSAEPARVVADLRELDGQVRLEARIEVPGGGAAVPVGAGGVAVAGPGGLLLAPLQRPLGDLETSLLAASPLQVPPDDLPRFRARYYPRLRGRVEVTSTDGSVPLPEVGPPSLRLEVVFGDGHRADLTWSFGYPVGDDVVRAPLTGGADVDRDTAAERALLEPLPALPALRGPDGRLLPAVGLRGADTARFATEALPLLQGLVEVVVTGEPAAYAHTDAAPVVAVSTADRPGERDWFDLGVRVTVADQDVPLATLLTALTTGEAHLVLESGTWFDLDRPELEALRGLLEEARGLTDPESGELRVSAYQAGLWEELVALGVVGEQSARWKDTVGRLLDPGELTPPDVPASLAAQLRPYQHDGFAWLSLLWDLGLGGVLADDMGLGKTLQTLALAARQHERGALAEPLLVVAPTSVVGAWAAEAARFCPSLPVAVLAETSRRSGRPLAERVEGAAVVVTSYAVLRLDGDDFVAHRWAGLVLDEAQQVKNPRSKAYAVVRRLPAPVKFAVTGTPLENSLMDLWALLSIVAPGLFADPEEFTRVWRAPIESGQDPERLPALRRRIAPADAAPHQGAGGGRPAAQGRAAGPGDPVARPPAALRRAPAARAAAGDGPAGRPAEEPVRRPALPHPAAPAEPGPGPGRPAARLRGVGQDRRAGGAAARGAPGGPPGAGVQLVHRVPGAGARPGWTPRACATATSTAAPATGPAGSRSSAAATPPRSSSASRPAAPG